MNELLSPNISSFVIRFVAEPGDSEQRPQPYRGAIRHIQSEEELQFSDWEDAVAFIQRFVEIEAKNT